MLPLAIAALAELAPAIIGLVTKDRTATKAAEVVSQTARAITGRDTDEEALEALKGNPELLVQYREKMNEHAAAMYAEDTKRIEAVNDTMRLEVANQHAFVRNMRPLFGYTVIYCLFMTFNTVLYTLVRYGPEDAVAVIAAFSEMEWVFIAMLSAIGVYIKKRSDDKNPSGAGLGLLGTLAKRLAGR